VLVSSEGGLDDDELAALADDPELDAYLQVTVTTV
jgi:2-hydroxychromene-2-carboxylate isomerase